MKYLSFLFVLCFTYSSVIGQADDAIDKYFSKYQDDDRFTMIQVSPKMFEMFAKVAPEDIDQEVRDMISNMRGLRVLISETSADDFYQEAISTINTSEYEELITVRGEDENVKVLVKDSQNGDIVNELLLLVGGDEFVMLSIVGDIDLKTVSKLARDINIDGMHHLDKLKDIEKKEKRKKH